MSAAGAVSAAAAVSAVRWQGDPSALAGGDPRRELRYWKARARELEAQLEALRAKLLVLVKRLPVADAARLDRDPQALDVEPVAADPFCGREVTLALTPSSVAAELRLVWDHLQRAARR